MHLLVLFVSYIINYFGVCVAFVVNITFERRYYYDIDFTSTLIHHVHRPYGHRYLQFSFHNENNYHIKLQLDV